MAEKSPYEPREALITPYLGYPETHSGPHEDRASEAAQSITLRSPVDDRYDPAQRHRDESADLPVHQKSAWERIGRARHDAALAAEKPGRSGVHGQPDHQREEHDTAGGDNTKKKHNLGKRIRGLFCVN
ncbi:hypothetical protein CKM354_000019000 [Cercospora kikuchii]|uniref:Uncharacterized protein n=1 Tax=Cercospora kikuchii TaxID=84275 RepID=A0A9P3F7J6_9PEZI|nr:uncharacterized protein CKM354_000019000 [Cercospora kikuchii]GIZ36723.1 hypothetical protein CKM354_000019000 [Cercospora kikuchii]